MIKLGASARPVGARGMLLDCHERIRKFAGIALRLAAGKDHPANEVREAVQAVHRYFTVALPLHEADEEQSLQPRLVPSAALATMVSEHREIDALLGEELVPRWTRLIDAPADRALRLATGDPAQRLSALMQRHLELEEQSIFPAIDLLSPDVQAALVAEMRGRRG